MAGTINLIMVVWIIQNSILGAVAQAKLTISPAEVVLTSSSPPLTTFTCAFESGVSVQDVYNMQMLRQRETDTSETALAELKGSVGTAAFVLNAPADVQNRANVSGQIETTKRDSRVVLTFNTSDIECSDRGHYFCSVSYQDTSSVNQNGITNQTLQLYALPADLMLSATKNGVNLAGGTLTNQADVNVGENVQFTCSGKIGSVNTTLVRWRRTSEIGTVDNLIIYNPPVGSHSNGDPSFVSNECTYTRAATMTYNVSSADANRDNNLAFQCYVSVAPPNGQGTYEVHSEIFYITVNNTESKDSYPRVKIYQLGIAIGGVSTLILAIGVVVAVVYVRQQRKKCRDKLQSRPDVSGPYELPNRNAIEMDHQYDQTAPVYDEIESAYENQ